MAVVAEVVDPPVPDDEAATLALEGDVPDDVPLVADLDVEPEVDPARISPSGALPPHPAQSARETITGIAFMASQGAPPARERNRGSTFRSPLSGAARNFLSNLRVRSFAIDKA